jgi:hypothetical protein
MGLAVGGEGAAQAGDDRWIRDDAFVAERSER